MTKTHKILMDYTEGVLQGRKGKIEFTEINGMNAVIIRFILSETLFINQACVLITLVCYQ